MGRIVVADFAKTLDQGRPPSELPLGGFTSLSNFYQFGGKLRRRGGMRRMNDTVYTDAITGIAFTDTPIVGTNIIIGSVTTLASFLGSTLTAISVESGYSLGSSTKRWTLFQYKGVTYGIRPNIFARTDGTTVMGAGIAAPSTAPILADGAAGDIPGPADFKGVYTFYNHLTGMESNPSPVSDVYAHADGNKINWSGITASTTSQVTRRRLYRSLADQSGEYFFVAEIADNTSTTYTGDNVLAEDLGDAVSYLNGVPPTGLLFGDIRGERLYVSDGEDLFYSEDGLIEAFDPDGFIPIFPDDGHQIRAVRTFGDRTVVGKTKGIHYIVGTSPSNFRRFTISDKVGCVSHHSMQAAEGNLFWLGPDDVYRSDGSTVVGIASLRLRTIIEAMDDAAAADATATVFPALGWYVLVIPGYAQLIYNYRTDTWTTLDTSSDIYTVGEFFDSDFDQQIMVSDSAGYFYRLHDTEYGFDDAGSVTGNSISASFIARSLGAEAGTSHIITHALILAPQYDENITLAILSEGTSLKSREVSLDYAPRWKTYSLSTRHKAVSQSQLQVTYSGETAIEIEGFALDVLPLNRPAMQAR